METRASDVMRRWFREVWCEGCEGTIEALFPEHALAHGLGPEPVRGPGAFRAFWSNLRAVFRDIQIQVVDVIDEGERCYVRCTSSLTFRGRKVSLGGGCQCTVRGGQIVECWNTWDFLGLLTEMGALPEDAIARSFAGERARFQA